MLFRAPNEELGLHLISPQQEVEVTCIVEQPIEYRRIESMAFTHGDGHPATFL